MRELCMRVLCVLELRSVKGTSSLQPHALFCSKASAASAQSKIMSQLSAAGGGSKTDQEIFRVQKWNTALPWKSMATSYSKAKPKWGIGEFFDKSVFFNKKSGMMMCVPSSAFFRCFSVTIYACMCVATKSLKRRTWTVSPNCRLYSPLFVTLTTRLSKTPRLTSTCGLPPFLRCFL